ncbi:MAG: hypothetical protein PHY02_00875 [Phycisphaerae bacterium]|nr:hypothetical protein [Phycisphaerae bacterium]
MNLKRGFWRITLVLSVVGAIFCAFCAVGLVLDERDNARSYLQWKEGQYKEKYGILPPKALKGLDFSVPPDEFKKEGERKTLDEMATTPKKKWMPKSAVLVKEPRGQGMFSDLVQQTAEEEIRELRNGFWVNLSEERMESICVLAFLAGGVIGFFCTLVTIWLVGLSVYKLIRWIVLGFYD